MKKEGFWFLIDEDGGVHEFYGIYEDVKAIAIERGYDLDNKGGRE